MNAYRITMIFGKKNFNFTILSLLHKRGFDSCSSFLFQAERRQRQSEATFKFFIVVNKLYTICRTTNLPKKLVLKDFSYQNCTQFVGTFYYDFEHDKFKSCFAPPSASLSSNKETCTRVKTFFVRQTQNCKIQVFDPKITHQIDGKLILQCRLMIYVHN